MEFFNLGFKCDRNLNSRNLEYLTPNYLLSSAKRVRKLLPPVLTCLETLRIFSLQFLFTSVRVFFNSAILRRI